MKLFFLCVRKEYNLWSWLSCLNKFLIQHHQNPCLWLITYDNITDHIAYTYVYDFIILFSDFLDRFPHNSSLDFFIIIVFVAISFVKKKIYFVLSVERFMDSYFMTLLLFNNLIQIEITTSLENI